MVAIKVAGATEIPASHKEGMDYDVNPATGNEVEPLYRLPDRVIYCDDLRKGGDGRSWSRTNKQGVIGDAKKGIQSRWKSASAAAERVVFTPTEAYREQYERVFGHS